MQDGSLRHVKLSLWMGRPSLLSWKSNVQADSEIEPFKSYLQIFYRTHIICFVLFMVFGFIHHYQLWAYSMPG